MIIHVCGVQDHHYLGKSGYFKLQLNTIVDLNDIKGIGRCFVYKEAEDNKICTTSGWAVNGGYDPNSQLFYKMVKQLRDAGYDVIKKRMCKDGHLVDDSIQYIKTRKHKPNGFMIWDSSYAICSQVYNFNENGKAVFYVIRYE